MPGKRITDHQVHRYRQERNRHRQAVAAAKAGISERSARRIERADGLPSQRPPRSWRTRTDPLGLVWDAEVVPLLGADPQLNAVTLLEELQRRHPGQYGTNVLRTLQRRVRHWRAVHGAEREVYFAQEHPPGRLNLAEQEELTQRYEDLCRHYGMRASRSNPGCSHENGAIEARHDSLKTALDQALRLRGSRRFDDRAAYETFVEVIVQRLNQRVGNRLAAERAMLRALPSRRTAEFEELPARVSKYAIFTVRGVQYSAPSQLIGHRLMVRLYAERIEGWLGGVRVLECPRPSHRGGARHPRSIDYRHPVAALKRKPGAFARWVLRDAVFPRPVYRQTWERLAARLPERAACKTIVGLLGLAADGHESQLAQELEQLIELDQLPDLAALTALLAPRSGELPAIDVQLPSLAGYDELLAAGEATAP